MQVPPGERGDQLRGDNHPHHRHGGRDVPGVPAPDVPPQLVHDAGVPVAAPADLEGGDRGAAGEHVPAGPGHQELQGREGRRLRHDGLCGRRGGEVQVEAHRDANVGQVDAIGVR